MQSGQKQSNFSICLGKILLTQEIIHTRNQILTPALGNSPSRKRLHPSLDLKSVVRKNPSLYLPSLLCVEGARESSEIIQCTDIGLWPCGGL